MCVNWNREHQFGRPLLLSVLLRFILIVIGSVLSVKKTVFQENVLLHSLRCVFRWSWSSKTSYWFNYHSFKRIYSFIFVFIFWLNCTTNANVSDPKKLGKRHFMATYNSFRFLFLLFPLFTLLNTTHACSSFVRDGCLNVYLINFEREKMRFFGKNQFGEARG